MERHQRYEITRKSRNVDQSCTTKMLNIALARPALHYEHQHLYNIKEKTKYFEFEEDRLAENSTQTSQNQQDESIHHTGCDFDVVEVGLLWKL